MGSSASFLLIGGELMQLEKKKRRKKYGGVVLGIVSLFPHLLGSRSTPVPLRRQLGVKQV